MGTNRFYWIFQQDRHLFCTHNPLDIIYSQRLIPTIISTLDSFRFFYAKPPPIPHNDSIKWTTRSLTCIRRTMRKNTHSNNWPIQKKNPSNCEWQLTSHYWHLELFQIHKGYISLYLIILFLKQFFYRQILDFNK